MPARRAYGMDQDFYPRSPIVKRPVLRWPDNARVALAVIVNLEHRDWEVPPGTPVAVSPMGYGQATAAIPRDCGRSAGQAHPFPLPYTSRVHPRCTFSLLRRLSGY